MIKTRRADMMRGFENLREGSGRLLFVGPHSGVIRGSDNLRYQDGTLFAFGTAQVGAVRTASVGPLDNDGTNAAGTALTISGGAGTGTGAGGAIVLKVADGGNSGSNSNATATALTIADDRTATFEHNVVVKGDLTLDDGGSIKEAGGTAAITISAAGEVTRIGTANPSDAQVLSWSASNGHWQPATVQGGGGGGGTASNDVDLILHTQVFG